jgi:hypothetical protein
MAIRKEGAAALVLLAVMVSSSAALHRFNYQQRRAGLVRQSAAYFH